MTQVQREFFPRVRKTVIPRPVERLETDVLGHSGSVRAAAATIYGPNWYHNPNEDLIEIWDAGPALCFKDVLPRKDKYAREGLYLRLSLAYRTTANAFVNMRTFSGNNVTLPNHFDGTMYDDPYTRFHITDDFTLNINSIYQGERFWLQRVDWEWVSSETIFEDELASANPHLERTPEQVEAIYAEKEINEDTVKEFLIDKLRSDPTFAKRSLMLLMEEKFLTNDLVALYESLNHGADRPEAQAPAKPARRRRTSKRGNTRADSAGP